MNTHMAIVKATYTKSRIVAKAAIRYIQHRTGKDGEKLSRELFGFDGVMDRQEAYQMIDAAGKGTAFFRLVISPDPKSEDTEKDLHLQVITEQTILALEQRIEKPVQFVAVEHDDHAPHRHVHIVACVAGRLNTADFKALRDSATDTARSQRHERDQQQEHHRQQQEQQQQEGGQWVGQGIS
jgi:hypothetical protein